MLSCTCSSEFFVLEQYLRLATRRPGPWLSSLQALTGCPRLSQEISYSGPGKNFFGRLAFMPANLVDLCGIYLNSSLKIFGSHAEAFTVIMPLRGAVEFEVRGENFVCAPGVPYVLEPGAEFNASVSEAADIFIVQLKQSYLSETDTLPKTGDPELAAVLDSYLAEMPFFRDHEHAMERTRAFEHALIRHSEDHALPVAEDSDRQIISNERRICHALKLINEQLDKSIDLEAIARDSGLSLRNFYYLMNRFTGMAPYTYCRARRLIKARESLIRHFKDDSVIADHARKWGFKHQGRFSAYYFDHFNEYPSVTVERVRCLLKNSQQVTASENRVSAWYTSTNSDLGCEA